MRELVSLRQNNARVERGKSWQALVLFLPQCGVCGFFAENLLCFSNS